MEFANTLDRVDVSMFAEGITEPKKGKKVEKEQAALIRLVSGYGDVSRSQIVSDILRLAICPLNLL
jgi:hypothetical protein